MTFGGQAAADKARGALEIDDVKTIVDRALDSEINFIDTADVYAGTESETLVGEAIKSRRNEVVLATKCGAKVGMLPNQVGLSRMHMMEALEASLRRLQTDRIDLYQVHNFDPHTPIESIMRTLDDMVHQGKVRAVGCSNFAAWQLTKAMGISKQERLEPFVSIQSFYSLANRDIETEILPALNDAGLSLICWSPLAGGVLSGKFTRTGVSDPGARRNTNNFPPIDEDKTLDVVDVLMAVAQRHGATVPQVALAWLLAQNSVTSLIIGAKRISQLNDNLGALDIALTEQDMAELNKVSDSPVRYPGWIQSFGAAGKVPQGYPFTGPSWGLGEEPI
jgi:aryl-alcohol dehydrogenase-like predicted oxidoreductase